MSQIFDNKYYRGTKFFACATGRWPYQTQKERYLFGSLVISCCFIQFVGEVFAVVLFSHDKELILESISPFIIDITCSAKYFSNLYHFKRVKRLFDDMKESWTFYKNKSEQNILHEYAELGRICVWVYTGGVYITTAMFILEPVLPRFMNILLNKNETIPLRYPVPIYWVGVDMIEDYRYTVTFSSICILAILTIEVSLDTSFIVLLQHSAGLFAVTGYILENIPTQKDFENERRGNHTISLDDLRYKHYVKCIKSHQRAIKFAEDLEVIYVWGFGVVIALNIPIMSVTATQLTTQAHNIEQTLKYSMFAISQALHAFALCAFSQRLITSSLRIEKSASNGLWYECNVNTQKLLTLVMLRSQHECKVTAGKVVVLSMETFTVILKTAASYFTVLASMQ